MKAVKVTPPFLWFQNLNQIIIEIKYAHRHDVAGCATLFNETIEITQREMYVSASCSEVQDTNLFYELRFPFWAAVNATSYRFEKRPVGKFYFVIDKLEKPARWRALHKEGTVKPVTGKIWLEKH